ncbi:MAG TPA: queuosine precursor transporter [Prochlorococcaceae cyanobacterium AMR_MDS_5431]|nr:queuosine precursor transporter [Prochlorococcaceae cyanobacterium AMR_MDS_5431]
MHIQQRREFAFLILAGLFLGTMGMLNILGVTRFLYLGSIGSMPLIVAVGALPYPLTFLCTDLISEIWGESKAGQLVWIGFIVNCWIILILWLGGISPGLDGFSGFQGLPLADTTSPMPTFYEIRRLAFGSAGASMVAYLTAQFIDVRLFHYWKNLTKGEALWLRNNGSTLISQLVDTTAVVLISHFTAHILPIDVDQPLLPQLGTYIWSGYLFKGLIALADTIPFILMTGWLRCWLEVPGIGAEIPTDDLSIVET